jgi:hypothetical protein
LLKSQNGIVWFFKHVTEPTFRTAKFYPSSNLFVSVLFHSNAFFFFPHKALKTGPTKEKSLVVEFLPF